MFKRILILSCVLFISISQSGCIGFVGTTSMECNRNAESANLYAATPTPSTKEELIMVWGKPDEIITVSENEETWIYKEKQWCGVIPVLIIPIPFVLPVCEGFKKVDFQGNNATHLHTKLIDMNGFVLILIPPGGLGGGEVGGEGCKYPVLSGPVYSKDDKIPDNEALIYFYRQESFAPYDIKRGGAKLATLFNGGYFPYLSGPGERNFCVALHPGSSRTSRNFKQKNKGCVFLDVKPGQKYYIKLEIHYGFLWIPSPQLVLVDREVAEKEIAEFTRKKELLTEN